VKGPVPIRWLPNSSPQPSTSSFGIITLPASVKTVRKEELAVFSVFHPCAYLLAIIILNYFSFSKHNSVSLLPVNLFCIGSLI
jgi:hypothetical protein